MLRLVMGFGNEMYRSNDNVKYIFLNAIIKIEDVFQSPKTFLNRTLQEIC